MGDKDRKAKPVVLGQGVIEIHLLDNNKQFNIAQRLAALCLADEVAMLVFCSKDQDIPGIVSIISSKTSTFAML